MLREYEFTVITKADLPDSAKVKLFEKYEGLMTQGGGQILKKDDWGVRKLAFPIKKQHRGHYLNYDFVGQAESLSEMERLMRIDDNILRYLTLKLGEDVDPESRKSQLAKQAKEAKEAQEVSQREKGFGG